MLRQTSPSAAEKHAAAPLCDAPRHERARVPMWGNVRWHFDTISLSRCHRSETGCISMAVTADDEAPQRLLERLRRAEGEEFEDAFRRVYAAEKAVVYGLLLRLSADPAAAADLFQNVWLKLARHRKELREDTVLRAWLCTVARREYLNYRRAQALDLSRVLTLGLESAEQASSDPQLHELNAGLRQLSDADREVLLLTSVDGLSLVQAAVALGVTEPALRQRLSRARRRLAAALTGDDVWSRLRAWLPLKKESR